ncbi:2-aminoadipate transaminase-like isoform X1 [Arctopsyche grandis]
MSTDKELFQADISDDALLNHLFEESASLNVYDKSVLNLAAGAPGPDLFEPLPDMMKKAVQHRMEIEMNNNNYLFQYGPTAGLWGMREALANFLTTMYGDKVQRENLILTCGATHGLHLLVSSMLVPNGVIFVEEYTYMIALQLFKEFPNFRIIEVPFTDKGVDVEKLNSIAKDIKKDTNYNTSEYKPFWAIFYTIPNFHNPTGVLLPPDKCKQLVNVARELDILVVCDDVYNLLYYGDEKSPPARLFSYDRPDEDGYSKGHVVSNGSFSKILAPGFRIGWMEVPQRLAVKFRLSGIMQSGGSVNNVMFGIVQSLIELGLMEKHCDWFRAVYADRMKVFCGILERHLPDGCSFERAQGGFFIWLKVPVDAGPFLAWCAKRGGPGAVPAIRFRLSSLSTSYSKAAGDVTKSTNSDGASTSQALRLTIAFHNSATLAKAAEDLCNKLKTYMKETS